MTTQSVSVGIGLGGGVAKGFLPSSKGALPKAAHDPKPLISQAELDAIYRKEIEEQLSALAQERILVLTVGIVGLLAFIGALFFGSWSGEALGVAASFLLGLIGFSVGIACMVKNFNLELEMNRVRGMSYSNPFAWYRGE